MTKFGIRYALGAVAVAALAVLLGIGMVGPGARDGVLVGGSVALALQVASFWLLAVLLFPERRLLAFGLGIALRFLTVGIAALLLVPALALPPAPTLLTLVGVFLLTTLLEPVVLHTAPATGR
ncbi:hypothetical protein BH23GEM7_BH23GEM7_15790 [soil metagenome]